MLKLLVASCNSRNYQSNRQSRNFNRPGLRDRSKPIVMTTAIVRKSVVRTTSAGLLMEARRSRRLLMSIEALGSGLLLTEARSRLLMPIKTLWSGLLPPLLMEPSLLATRHKLISATEQSTKGSTTLSLVASTTLAEAGLLPLLLEVVFPWCWW